VGADDATLEATVGALTRVPERTALLLDFDGSLAPIVPHPEDARALPGTDAVLDAIARRLGLVAIVSGRPVGFFTKVFDAPNVRLVGQYGLEVLEQGRVSVDARALPFVPAVAAATEEADRRWPECYIERKGDVAVTVHWRRAPDAEESVVQEIDELAQRFGLVVHPGRMARELRPPVPVDKGTVVETLVAGYAVAAFGGDDSGDLPAFGTLARLEASGELERGLRIAVASAEMPPEVRAAADVVVDGPAGLRAVLDGLAAALG
jgi:trehalose 6-phosphate phosphatase